MLKIKDFKTFEVRLELDIKPMGQPRPQHSGRVSYYKKVHKQYMKDYENAINQAYERLDYKDKQFIAHLNKNRLKTLYIVSTLILEFEPAKSLPKYMRKLMLEGLIPHNNKPDIDNVEKMIWDRSSGVFFKDDTYIAENHTRKRYANKDRVLITYTYCWYDYDIV
jgi:Holliday junction resolvase RusA-like endonuclease